MESQQTDNDAEAQRRAEEAKREAEAKTKLNAEQEAEATVVSSVKGNMKPRAESLTAESEKAAKQWQAINRKAEHS